MPQRNNPNARNMHLMSDFNLCVACVSVPVSKDSSKHEVCLHHTTRTSSSTEHMSQLLLTCVSLKMQVEEAALIRKKTLKKK